MEFCRSCHQPVIWALSAHERPIVVDREPHADGNLRLVAGHAFTVPREARAAFPGQLHRLHWASCEFVSEPSAFAREPFAGGQG